jgi:GMP synthase-like glutamine amidotransferase
MRIHILRHVPFEGIGTIRHWADLKNHRITFTEFFHNDELPDPYEIDWLIVMGGPMNTNEEAKYPWLVREKRFISEAIERGRKVLGICLGAQMIASVLGAKVYPNSEKEIGWFPVALTKEGKESKIFSGLPGSFIVFQWHGDTFNLPKDSIPLAESEACMNQAFEFGKNVIALQFHLEVEKDNVEQLIENCGNEIREAPFIQTAEEIRKAEKEYGEIKRKIFCILDRMEGSNVKFQE